jgi:hypothetical protein
MKKVAFIGCSHFSVTEVSCQGYNNWTYQLYKKFPQHQYRNYSGGGRSMDYFQIALLHAKDWGADIVFVNRTYLGRWQMFAEIDIDGFKGFDFEVFDQQPNWQELMLKSQILWGNTHYNNSNSQASFSSIKKSADSTGKFLIGYMAGTETRKQYERMWYQNVTKLYDFENTFLIDWDEESHSDYTIEPDGTFTFPDPPFVTSNVNNTAVVTWFCERYDADGETSGNNPLYKHDIVISKDNNHLTYRGNKELLEDYILANKNVLNALTSHK